MRIVIDLQGAQTSGSRNRGIGRYSISLSQAIIRNRGEHEIIIVLNGLFPETIEPIRAEFSSLIPQDCIRVWNAPGPVAYLQKPNNWRRRAAELIREEFLANLQPDMVYVTSLFEGLGDDAVTSAGLFTTSIPTAVTLYDLIPLINRNPYLNNPVIESWYENKLLQVRRSNLLLAISESSRQEGIKHLGFFPDNVINIGTAADAQFKHIDIDTALSHEVRKRYGLDRQFVMYTGGIDHRKNIEGLIRAFALIPKDLRKQHQLAIVCSIQPGSRKKLEALIKKHNLAPDEVKLTGFVPEDDLIALYHICKVFIFPSWHEGFGLPALEAMACGAPVIASNTTSLPEVVGRSDALFDPYSDNAIAEKIVETLIDEEFRNDLIRHGTEQAKKFSWDASAKMAIKAFEKYHAESNKPQKNISLAVRRPKLAYISPLPPERSGIADYSAQLLPELSRHYEIDVIVSQSEIADQSIKENCLVRSVEWFSNHSHLYDRVIYHFGNSHYHQDMFDLLARVPGIVVLHDFFLSGAVSIISRKKRISGITGAWEAELYHSHGYPSLIEFSRDNDVSKSAQYYPCNKFVIENSQGIIVHSENSRRLASQWLGKNSDVDWTTIPLLRAPAITKNKELARRALNIKENAFVICSFGLLHPTKQNKRLLDAWLSSSMSKNEDCHLIFVGQNTSGSYGSSIIKTINKSAASRRIHITGWADTKQYHHYLASADVGVQLRTLSRGETSGTALDCMNYGLPTVINANGSMADIPDDVVWKLPDIFSDEELINCLETLWKNDNIRNTLGQRARELIFSLHAPRVCADQYAEAIEHYHNLAQIGKDGLVKTIAKLPHAPEGATEWLKLAQAIESNHKQDFLNKIMVDISEFIHSDADNSKLSILRNIFIELISYPLEGFRIEPIYTNLDDSGYFYARRFTFNFLNCSSDAISDDPVIASPGDIFLAMDLDPRVVVQREKFNQYLRRIGVKVKFFIHKSPPAETGEDFDVGIWQTMVQTADGVLCMSRDLSDELVSWLAVFGSKRSHPLQIAYLTESIDFSTAEKSSGSHQAPSHQIDFERIAKDLLILLSGEKCHRQWMQDDIQSSGQ